MGQDGCVSGDRAWQLVVPIKRAERGKSRLVPPPGVARSHLARAMACDALSVAAQVLGGPAVLVVTSDEPMRGYAESLGMSTIADPGGGLNHAVTAGFNAAAGSGDAAGLVAAPVPALAVLLPDLPALKASELENALDLCRACPVAMVADHSNTGTCLLTSTHGPVLPCFGSRSADRHQEVLGAVPLPVVAPGLRQDVDTADDLERALALGLGPFTNALLRR